MAGQDDHMFQALKKYRHALDREYPHLSRQQRDDLVLRHLRKINSEAPRSQPTKSPAKTSVAQQRSASCMASFGSDLHPGPSNFASMTPLSAHDLARQASAPSGTTMTSSAYRSYFPDHQPQSQHTNGFMSLPMPSGNQYDRPNNSNSTRSLQSKGLHNVPEVQIYSPTAYLLHSTITPQSMTNFSMTNSDLNAFHTPDVRENLSYEYEQDGGLSPVTSTSDSCLTTGSTAYSEQMSRSNTYGSVYGDFDMFRTSSTRSSLVDECGMASSQYTQPCFPDLHEVDFVQPFPLSQPNSLSMVTMGSGDSSDHSGEAQVPLSTKFSSSHSSSPQSATERVVPYKTLAPRKSKDVSKDAHMRLIAVEGEDGVIKHKAEIARAPRQPQQRKTTFCDFCNDKPQGFHGEHELRRHIERQHTHIRKVWVCQDVSEDGTFLRNCKNCRNNKAYGANYNAAAHLRRYHFNPCKSRRGGPNKKSEGRGGMGGGNSPSMDELKKWMYETYEENLTGRLVVKSIASDATVKRVPMEELTMYSTSYDAETDFMMTDPNQYHDLLLDNSLTYGFNQANMLMGTHADPQLPVYMTSMSHMPANVSAYTNQQHNDVHMSDF